jgi:hypothetical protein
LAQQFANGEAALAELTGDLQETKPVMMASADIDVAPSANQANPAPTIEAVVKKSTAIATAVATPIFAEPAKRAAQTLPPPSANVSNPAADLDTSAGRVQSAAVSEPAATHKDPGEPAEPVTAAVVREAIKTAAENEGRSRSAMKADALRLIDEAIAKAPEKGDKKITIKVPGDGTFTVVNNVARLREFRRQVELSPGFKDKQTRPSIGKANSSADYGPDQLAREMLEDGEPLNAVEVLEAAGKTMMFGNGGDSRPIPYTNGEPVEIAGVADLFVGRGWSAKKGNTSWWAVIH